MSKIGVNTNIYQVTRRYMNLLNDYIVSCRSQTNSGNNRKQQEVISLFQRITDDQNIEPNIQLLSVIIEQDLRQKNKRPKDFLNHLVSNLSKGDESEATLHELELVVNALDTEYTEALAKIKGE